MIKVITVGSVKEKYLREAIEEYSKRISKYDKIEIIEVKDEGTVEHSKAIILEAEKIKKYIKPRDYIITLEIEGKQMTSSEFSAKLENIFQETSNITFIIGGSYGLDDEIKIMSNFKLSFSKMTFPHQLFRVILLEQIYRAFKISHNESYHK